MKQEYRDNEKATKLLYAKDLLGLPSDISLSFNSAYVRFYKPENMNGYFHCNLAIPSFSDDEGYVLETEFLQKIDDEEEFDSSTYIIPFNEHSFSSLPKAVTCYFEEKTEMGQRTLLWIMKIKGTPFNGYAYIDPNLYNVTEG